MKIVQKQENRIPKRLNNMQCSEAMESNVMVNGWHFSGNVDSIPLKKRRLVYRSLSPPLQSSNSLTESDGLVVGQCVSDQYTHLNVTTESQVEQVNFLKGPKSKFSDCDGNIDEKMSSNDASGSGDDFSGIAILAAAACSDRIDISTDDAGKSQVQMGGLLGKEHDESIASASDVKESNTCIQSPELDVKDAEHVNRICAMDSPKDNAKVVSQNNDANAAGMSSINESQFVAVTSVNKESVECVDLFKLNRNDDAHVNKEPLADFPNEVADKSRENSSSTRDYQFHWDLNTAVDEWDHPLYDELDVDSSTCLVEVPPKNNTESHSYDYVKDSLGKESEIQNLEDAEGLEAKRCEATEKNERVNSQPEACAEAECLELPHNAHFTSVLPTVSKMEHCSELSSGFVTSIIKETFSTSNVNDHVVETLQCVTDSAIQPEMVNDDATFDHSLSLGLNGTKKQAAEETCNGTDSDIVNEVAEETNYSTQSLLSKEHIVGFLLASFADNALSEGKDANCKNFKDFKDSNGPSNNKVTSVTFQPTATKSFDSSKCEIVASFESGDVSCKVNDLDTKISEASENLISLVDCEVKHEGVVGLPLECQPSCSESQMGELKHSIVPLCASKLEDMITTSMTLGNDRAIGRVITEELEEKPTVRYVSESDPFNKHRFDSLVPKTLNGNVDVDVSNKRNDGHLVQDSLRIGQKPYISNDDSSQVGENAGMVTEMETGYESHLEDGELKESYCWEDNEGEEGDTEHVDYDSDNRDGAVFYEAAKDSVQFSGEVLVGEGEKHSFQLDTISSVDEKPNPDLSVEDNCSPRFQVCVSTVDAMEAVCTNRKSLSLKACTEANDSKKVETTQTDRSSVEVHSTGKDVDDEPQRNAIGASVSGRNLQISDRIYADSMRRSSSGNFDCMHDGDGPDESLTRSQRSLHGMGRFGGRSWNPDLKSVVAKSTSEDDGVGSGDTSPLRGRESRIINTSRGGCHFVRRGLPGERDSEYGMGMVKARDIIPDYNQRIRFGRSNGISRGGFREGYRRPGVYDGPKSAGDGPMLTRFSRRDRSFSPVGNRFHRKPRSRSRTRSPDFKCGGRMGRGRLPFQQANHSAEHTRERRSPVRVFDQGQRFDVNDSPGRLRSDDCVRSNMRTIRFHDATTSGRGHDFKEGDDFRRKPFLRNHRRSRSRSRSCSPDFRPDARISSMRVPFQPSGDQIRDRRSPARVFRPDQRYDGSGSPVRLRSDECLRPMRRPIRFSDSTQPGRAHEFNNNSNSSGDEYRRKPRNIFERIHPIRHDVEGDARRFQFDDDEALPNQNFRRNNNFVRGGERRRSVEFNRGPKQERGNIRYNNSERMFYSGPKQFGGMREYGSEDGRPRRIGP